MRAELNAIGLDARAATSLHTGFPATPAATPDAPGGVLSSAGNLTYGELREKVLAVAAALAVVAGVPRASVVAVLGPKSVEQVIALLAISTVGAAYLPVGVTSPPIGPVASCTPVRDFALVCGIGAQTTPIRRT